MKNLLKILSLTLVVNCAEKGMPEHYELSEPLKGLSPKLQDVIEKDFTKVDLSTVEVGVVLRSNFDGPTTSYGRYYDDGYILLVLNSGENCLSLAHEFLHAALHQENGDLDPDHIDPRFTDGTIWDYCYYAK